MCWYCRWGVPVAVADIYYIAEKKLGETFPMAMHYGPAHIVWDDNNLSDENIKWCIEHFDEYKHGYPESELEVVMWSLKELLKIPEKERDIAPEDDEGCHLMDIPPTVETVRI